MVVPQFSAPAKKEVTQFFVLGKKDDTDSDKKEPRIDSQVSVTDIQKPESPKK
jgi:hypothetical protein